MTRASAVVLRVGRLAVPGAVLVLVAAGCVAEPPGPPSSAVSPVAPTLPTAADVAAQPGSLAWGDGSAVVPTVVSTTTARVATAGVDYVPLLTAAPGADGSVLAPLALTADGRLVVSRVPAGQYDGGAWLAEPSQVGALEGVEPFAAWSPSEEVLRDEHPRQTFAGSAGAGVVAWAETASTQAGVDPWRLFARTDAGATTLVARAEDAGAGSELTSIAASADRVFWASSRGVASRDVSGTGDVRLEVGGADQPALGAGGLYVVRDARTDPSVPGGSVAVERADGDGGSVPVLAFDGPDGASGRSLVADGDRLAVVLTSPSGSGATIELVDLRSSAATRVVLPGAGSSTSLALCGDRLVWTSADGSGTGPDEPVYVLDVLSGELVGVPLAGTFGGVLCAGGLVGWRTLPPGVGASATTTVVRWLDG